MAPTKAAKRAAKTIEPEILKILRDHLVWDNGVCQINHKLDPKTYKAVNKVLEALTGKWDKKIKGHVFEGDGETLVNEAVALGVYLDAKTAFQFFETPSALADKVVQIAYNLWVGQSYGALGSSHATAVDKRDVMILEPSCGTGSLISSLIAKGYAEANIVGIDVNPAVLDVCRSRFPQIDAYNQDFLQVQEEVETSDIFRSDIIVMNPPFSQLDDVRHVLHALKFLKPGGVLVAIMSLAWTYRKHRLVDDLKVALGGNLDTTYWEPLPDQSFKESGTTVRTGLLAVKR